MICELHDRQCNVCELIDRGVTSPGAFYFAGIVHGVLAGRVRIPLCKLHFAAWQLVENDWKRSPLPVANDEAPGSSNAAE